MPTDVSMVSHTYMYAHTHMYTTHMYTQNGEVTFFDLQQKCDVATVNVSGYVDTLLMAHNDDSSTHLLVHYN